MAVSRDPIVHPAPPRLDTVHLLASLCDAAYGQPLPVIAAAVGANPITWHELSPDQLTAPDDAHAIGCVGGGTTPDGTDVVCAFVVQRSGRQRAVVFGPDRVISTTDASGRLVADCRAIFGLPPDAA